MSWISDFFSSNKTKTLVATLPVVAGEQQGRKVTSETQSLPVVPAAAEAAKIDLTERKIEQKEPESKIEQLAKLLASMSPEEKAAAGMAVVQSIKTDHEKKNTEFSAFMETFQAPASWIGLEKVLSGVRKACNDESDTNNYQCIIDQCSGCSRLPSKDKIEEYRVNTKKFYAFIEQFEKNPETFNPESYTNFHLFVMLSCDGLKEQKAKIAKTIVQRILASDMEISSKYITQHNAILSTERFMTILKHTQLSVDEVKQLVRHISLNDLLNDVQLQDELKKYYGDYETYNKEVFDIINHLTDKALAYWLTHGTEDWTSMDTSISYEIPLAKELAFVSYKDENFEARLTKVVENSKESLSIFGPSLVRFVGRYKVNVEILRNIHAFLTVLSRLGPNEQWVQNLERQNNQMLCVKGNSLTLRLHLNLREMPDHSILKKIGSEHPNLLLKSLDIESLLSLRDVLDVKAELAHLVKYADQYVLEYLPKETKQTLRNFLA